MKNAVRRRTMARTLGLGRNLEMTPLICAASCLGVPILPTYFNTEYNGQQVVINYSSNYSTLKTKGIFKNVTGEHKLIS